MNDKKRKSEPDVGNSGGMIDNALRWLFRSEVVSAAPGLTLETPEVSEAEVKPDPVVESIEQPAASHDSLALNHLVREFANCLWYLKTKYFKRAWDDAEIGDDDPSVRRALSRINKSIVALREGGIEVDDPTGQRYPQGGEGMMRPIELLPTAGLTVERVSETVAPIVYRDDRLIQRGEVFVAVPKYDATATGAPTDTVAAAAAATSAPSTVEAQTSPLPAEANSETDGIGRAKDDGCKDTNVLPQPDGTVGEEPLLEHATAACEAPELAAVRRETDELPGLNLHQDAGDEGSTEKPTGKTE